jgi:exosome complex exonuclease RRP6
MHGADMDIGWLQRDFGIYVVNMFDTGQATRVLDYPRFSLAFLLKKFCDVMANKQYQLADWRIRPLPAEMVLYAREDTHYLLYIYERLRNELVAKGNEHNNLLESVYERSKNICLKVYEKPMFTSKSHLNLYRRHKKALTPHQLEAFRLLYAWRDQIARLEDESYAYVLPNHMLFGLAEVLPKEPQGVLACCNPIPSLVRQNINEIHRLIVQAREVGPKSNSPVVNVRSVSTRESSSESMKVGEPIMRNTRQKPQGRKHLISQREYIFHF